MQTSLTDCRFCSVVAQANGDDPIGSAPTADHWLIVELPQPWSAQLFSEDPLIQPVFAQLKALVRQGYRLRPIAIAPDREYSQAGHTRIFYYRRPAAQFANFERHEYLVPTPAAVALATAILRQIAQQPHDLPAFEPYRQVGQFRDLLVCTHGNVDAACARFGFPLYDRLRRDYSSAELRVWRCTHFGGHQYAPTLLDLPSGRFWGHLKLTALDALVYQQGSPTELYSSYRGWAGFDKFEQIAEREIWMQVGWDWFSYPKQGRMIRLGESFWRRWLRTLLQRVPEGRVQMLLRRSAQEARWATVRIDYETPAPGAYEARVEIQDQVLTAIRSSSAKDLAKDLATNSNLDSNPDSNSDSSLVPVNRYRVTALTQLF